VLRAPQDTLELYRDVRASLLATYGGLEALEAMLSDGGATFPALVRAELKLSSRLPPALDHPADFYKCASLLAPAVCLARICGLPLPHSMSMTKLQLQGGLQ
jgi:hypothetical protein